MFYRISICQYGHNINLKSKMFSESNPWIFITLAEPVGQKADE